MPWIKEDMCTGCGLCVGECPVGAIELKASGCAEIDEVECIRCGRCHDVCPQGAVRHDGERIPQEVAENLRWVRKLLEHFQRPEEQAAFMQRMVRFFNKEKKVCARTLAVIATLGDQPAADIDAAIAELSEGNDAQSSKG